MNHGMPMMGMMAFGFAFVVLVLVALIVGVVWMVRRLSAKGATRSGQNHDEPLDIAKRRYAAGEISQSELEEIKHHLAQGGN